MRAASGRELAEATGPAANIYVDFDAGLGVIGELAAKVIARAGLGPANRREIAVGVGLAGLSSPEDAARVAAALPGWARVEVANDAVAACIGANGPGDGGLIIAGTGTAGIARIAGVAKIVGGRGFLLGDDGSGARIGADAVRAALRAFDGLAPMSGLSRALLADFDADPLRMTKWAQAAKPGDYGAFAPRVFEAARAGESEALEIVRRAGRAIVAIFRALEALGVRRIAIVGGVAGPLRTYLPAEVEARLTRPQHDAVDGAILLAGGALPTPGGLP
jgi:glucosamine kinase